MIALALMIATATGLALYFAAPLIKAKSRAAALALGLAAPAAAFALYLVVGSPAYVVGDAGQRPQAGQAEETIAQLEALVAEQPTNLQAWDSLASVRMSVQDIDGAIEAYEGMAALEPEAADIRASLGEARVLARGGVVDETAAADFEAALALDPAEPRAIYYLAEAEYQAGRTADAIARWSRLAETSPPNAPWLAALGARLQRAALVEQISLDGLGLDSEVVAKLEAAMQGPAGRGPDADAMAAMANLSPEEQQAQIEAMVAGLAARLEDEPDDLQGWIRLARSYETLGREEEYVDALGQIVRLSPNDVEARRAHAYAVLGLNSETGGAMQPATIEALEALLELDGEDPLALLSLGVHANLEGDQARSRVLLTRLAESETAPESLREQARSLLQSYSLTTDE
ncbi:MAG: tetratricopeptide repeat protein [Maricaulaceae bacterium]|jgi:cytochrome c-type biogenesis protein CcmH